jgi:YVTN family beta-propeller protein
MRSKVILCAVFCLLCSVSTAQWLETTLAVGDYPEALCYNSVNNKVYCACNGPTNDVVYVIDGETNVISAQIEVGVDVYQSCYNPTTNKVYCSDWFGNLVAILCGAGDTVINYVDARGWRGVMAYDPVGDKVYSYGDSGNVAVISGAGDSVLAILPVGGESRSICCSPDHRKVFCGANYFTDTVSVIDCATDSIVAMLLVGTEPTGMCYNPTNGCVYCLADYDPLMSVMDCATNQLVASVDVGYGQSSICCAPAENKVFCTTSNGRFVVVDAATNSVVDSLETGDFFSESFYNQLNNKVYCLSFWRSNNVTVIDAATHEVLTTIAVDSGPQSICHNPRQNRVYVANDYSASVSVIRDSGGGVAETMNDERGTVNTSPTIVRGVLMVGDSSQNTVHRAELFDIQGRKVLGLRPGANDVSRLAPGVYFAREAQAQAFRRVVITK